MLIAISAAISPLSQTTRIRCQRALRVTRLLSGSFDILRLKELNQVWPTVFRYAGMTRGLSKINGEGYQILSERYVTICHDMS